MDKAPAGKNTRGDKAPADKFIDLFLYVCYTHFHEGLILQEDNFRLRERSEDKEDTNMKHIKTLSTRNLQESMKKGGCGECQTSCQSACKTSCTVGNQSCEKVNK